MCMKIRTFWKKNEPSSLIISEIIEYKRSAYLNISKVLLQNTIQQSTYSQVPNTAEISARSLLSSFSMNMK